MATAQTKDRDEDDDDDDASEPSDPPETGDDEPADEDRDDERDEEDGDGDDEDGDDEKEEEAPKAAPRAAARPAPAAARPPAGPPASKGWPREVVVLGMVLSAVAGALAFSTLPSWNPGLAARLGKGQTVELTLVAADRDNLACGSATVIDGLRCGFDGEGKPWPAGAAPSGPGTTLQPYTTTDRKTVLAAGVWDDPALEKSKLPAKRFKVRCDFSPVGEAVSPKVRWAKGPFKDATGSWRVGRVSKCAVLDG